MRATYTSRCPECDEPIRPDEMIHCNPDGQWVHQACAAPEGEPIGTYAFCPDCGLELPASGACDCTKETGR